MKDAVELMHKKIENIAAHFGALRFGIHPRHQLRRIILETASARARARRALWLGRHLRMHGPVEGPASNVQIVPANHSVKAGIL